MIDFDAIGKRIFEERKYLHRVSQEKMAEDLGMWQADISNLEKAKSGSGITDLEKLDRIAEYFNMPLETLLFGRRQDQMEKYQGSKMQLKETTRKKSKKHETLLRKLMGLPSDETAENALDIIPTFECGPYTIYAPNERQMMLSGGSGNNMVPPYITKLHIYVVYQDEIIASLSAYWTSVSLIWITRFRFLIRTGLYISSHPLKKRRREPGGR